MKKLVLVYGVLCLVLGSKLFAQEAITTFGIQLKPVFPQRYFDGPPIRLQDDNFNGSLSPKPGYALGMVVRKGFTKMISMEVGINLVKRNFRQEVWDTDSASFRSELSFGMQSYEIPLLGLVYIKLGEQLYMNNAVGFSFDFFPQDIFAASTNYSVYGVKRSWVNTGVNVNLGFEYRTKEKGFFYLGASFHQPFNSIYRVKVTYVKKQDEWNDYADLTGRYLTLDLRYFFHEDPEKRIKKKKG